MNEHDEYLERLGVYEPVKVESPIEWSEIGGIQHVNWDEMYHNIGVRINTECGWQEMLDHLHRYAMLGRIRSFEVDRIEPEYIHILGGMERVPMIPRPAATLWITTYGGHKLKFEVDYWHEINVGMMLTEIQFEQHSDGVRLVGF